MKHLRVLMAGLAAGLVGASAAVGGQIVVPAGVEAVLRREAARPLATVPLDGRRAEATRQVMRTWVSGSMNLQTATKRVSPRFRRTSFTQQVRTLPLRLPTERLELPRGGEGARVAPRLRLAGPRRLTLARPQLLVFREGPGHLYYQRFVDRRAARTLPAREAVAMAREFLTQNTLLVENAADKVGEVHVVERRVQEDGGERRRPSDYLVQQDVVFERLHQGRPVINARVVVGLQPDTREIVLLKHLNWTPGRAGQAKALPPRMRRAARSDSSDVLRQRISERILRTSGKRFARAHVARAIAAWYQTRDALIPVVVFETVVQFRGPAGLITEPYLEAINLAGPDDVILAHQGAAGPDAAPAAAPGGLRLVPVRPVLKPHIDPRRRILPRP